MTEAFCSISLSVVSFGIAGLHLTVINQKRVEQAQKEKKKEEEEEIKGVSVFKALTFGMDLFTCDLQRRMHL